MRTTALIALAVLLLLAVAFALAWPLLLPGLTYVPEPLSPDAARPERHGLPTASEVWLEAADGVRLHGWWVPAAASGWPRCDAVAIYFHGNAGTIVSRASIAGSLARRGLDVLLFDYRGYGRSEGRPSEPGLRADAEAALRYVREERRVATGRVVLIGQSLGSAVALRLALDHAAGGLILGAPFPGLPAAVSHHAPWLPVRLLRWPDGRYDAGSRIRELRVPLLVLAGGRDTLVPPFLSERVFEAAPRPKRLARVDAGHNGLMAHPASWDAIDGFLATHLGCGPRSP
ncbi:MAG TPA: alpha/beta fold hydrolase [Longimicrobiales bacterium]|nr:alpha/beta fold hydrolase [Longimicrobiales bacterium]